ncbi:multicopper oxidase domain-containing protein [Pseudocnuella soli]|uniref:multicopper oxidase domain-containing protein n=1 Tax=Pseudocnuella soli TaxID=2502779 RepID=UPI00104ACACB|nr:multicopper oxidase domain-containing protein [Pseudocnuella soli]
MKSNHLVMLGAVLLPGIVVAQVLLDPKTQPQFETPLPIPAVIDATSGKTLTLQISQFDQQLGLRDPRNKHKPLKTTVWGYERSYPGPTIVAKKDVPVHVFYQNKLMQGNRPLPHLLPLDASINWALHGVPNWQQFGVPVVTHLHGGHTESASDGLPEAWYTPNFTRTGPDFKKGQYQPYEYSNDQDAATLWYHDHAMGITRLNVYAGLAGFYLLTDDREAELQAQQKIPSGPYDIGLAIQDRMFTSDGQLYYPATPEEPGAPTPSILPEFFGDFILVNGAIWPVLEVEPRPYRFRMLNGSDSRFYNLFLSNAQGFTQIGTDNGLLPAPVPLQQMLIGPGERRDVVIDFSGWQGQTIIVHNDAATPFPNGDAVDPATAGKVMAFRVSKQLNTKIPKAALPASLRTPIQMLPYNDETVRRKLILFEGMDQYGRLMPMLGTMEHGALKYDDPVTENPALNSTEIWEIYNETEDAHPIHLHLVTMLLINRQEFTAATIDAETGKPTGVTLVGEPTWSTAGEAGWKDTYVLYSGQVTRVIARFDRAGEYAWHCHILSHEDHEMMRPYYVGNMVGAGMTNKVKDAPIELETKVGLQVSPNPFSNELSVALRLPQTATVAVNVYDAKGGLVQKIYSGKRDAGNQQFTLNGNTWANGVYFLEVVIDGQRMMRKIVLKK